MLCSSVLIKKVVVIQYVIVITREILYEAFTLLLNSTHNIEVTEKRILNFDTVVYFKTKRLKFKGSCLNFSDIVYYTKLGISFNRGLSIGNETVN